MASEFMKSETGRSYSSLLAHSLEHVLLPSGTQKLDGIYGSIVVREPPSQDPNSHLYDFDLTTHVMLLSDWMHEDAMERFPGRLAANTGQDPETILINGKGQFQVRVYSIPILLIRLCNVS